MYWTKAQVHLSLGTVALRGASNRRAEGLLGDGRPAVMEQRAPRLVLADAIEQKLADWASAGTAQEYYALGKRGPFKPQVFSELNRFGGAMGPYTDSMLRLQTGALEALARVDSVGGDMRALDRLIASSVEATRERRLWMVKSDFEFATIYAALAMHLRDKLRTDILQDGWLAGDFLEATSRPLQATLAPPQVDAWGKYDDPLKTPETYYSRFQNRPSS
ncbi:hypothetical protein T492DRAFT_844077 [Pavlovales sp. CCMP2436]|nr:hypothetical protein T492DRAFT_844077 [Pavlovales sp. CCMP2436]